jgi:hypothetical protein
MERASTSARPAFFEEIRLDDLGARRAIVLGMSQHAAIGSEPRVQPRIERMTILPCANMFAMESDALPEDDSPTQRNIAPLFDEDGNLTFPADDAAGPGSDEVPQPRDIARWMRAVARSR